MAPGSLSLLLLNKIKKLILLIYSGMVLGMMLSLFLIRSVWIDMRINTSLFLPLSVLAWTGAGVFFNKIPSAVLVLVLQAVLGLILMYTCGLDIGAWAVLPAALAKEGLFLKFMNLSSINYALIFLFLAGNLTLLTLPKPLKKPHALD